MNASLTRLEKNIFNPNEKDFEFLFNIKMSKYEIYFRVDIF